MLEVSAHDAALGVFAATLIFVVLFWRLGTPTFWDPDEAHYAETTREMIATPDWSVPYFNEQPFFDKPVLFHQLQGAAMRLFSDPEFGARIVPALAALGLVAITVWFGTVMVSGEVGMVAGLMLAACPGVFGLARYAILDTLFTMFMFGGAACLYCVMRRSAYDEFVAQGIPLTIRYEREGMWATSGRALWRTYTPLTRFVVFSAARE